MNSAAMTPFILAMCTAAPASADTLWASVPASIEARQRSTIAVPSDFTDSVVSLVGTVSAPVDVQDRRHPVISFDLPGASEGGGDGTPSKPDFAIVPEGAHRADSNNRISAGSPSAGIASGIPVGRNPWEVSVGPKASEADVMFLCGGIIGGGSRGPIAFLNGRIVKRGDGMDRFRIAGVLRDGVLLEKDGSFFVLPLGKRTIVSTGGG
jgi:hypothetical protein